MGLPALHSRSVDAALLVAVKLAIGAWVLHQGFTHVSDDDYARTVIAEQFAHAPRLDPSGTSWLPFPFWLEGAVMAVAGTSLGVARAIATTLGAASVAAPYLAMRAVGVRRWAAVAATAVAMALPWNAWLGVATVPEAWFGALVAAAAILLGRPGTRAWSAGALLVASLCRYEAWPVCALAALLCAWSADDGGHRRRDVPAIVAAAAGPIAWMAWNAHAHGSPFHFLSRVATFRHAVGAADASLVEKLFTYPVSLLEETPEVALLGIVGLAGLALPEVRARWKWAAVAAATVMVFLVWGDLKDGAPTHHPARALAALWWVLCGMGVDAAATWRAARVGARRKAAFGVAAAAAVAWCVLLPARWKDAPGRSPDEDRTAQIARGLDLRARHVEHAELRPCAFEQFALLAAWGEPERATVFPRSGAAVTDECPRVTER
ncbi:MAG TPA: hypothetical protein VGG39_30765 [Polyangiaceae bacterium]